MIAQEGLRMVSDIVGSVRKCFQRFTGQHVSKPFIPLARQPCLLSHYLLSLTSAHSGVLGHYTGHTPSWEAFCGATW